MGCRTKVAARFLPLLRIKSCGLSHDTIDRDSGE